MPLFSTRVVGAATLLLAAQASATTYLSPEQDINLPSSESATEPLEWLGANSPYFAGPNVNNISSTVPDGCVIDQVAYVVRHGSRYPDSGAYAEWVALYQKIGNASFVAQGSLEFLKDWQPVLTNPTAQISQESSTGYKEAYDLGYQLRTRYPQLYSYGSPFMSWANLYPRVVQTARNFVRGFLGSTAEYLGTVITVNSTGSPDAFFDSLSPSDLCPAFVDGNGGTEATTWGATYLPPITARLNSLLTGNLTFVDSDVSIFPYLCGFESQITGTLSPWCGVFTDDELLQYEYAQDLRYYYGTGPGTGLPSQMMLPFLNSLVGLLEDGPGQNGTFANGTSYTLPSILTAFLNDGQITELGAATGVWDDQTALSGTAIPDDWKYIASHFVTMRGTVAFERMTCAALPAITKRSYPEKNEPVTVTVDHTVTEHDCAPPAAPTSYTISTVYKTSIFTSKGHLTTKTVADYTTTCPVSATSASSPAKVTTVVGGKTSIVGGKTITIGGMTSIVGGRTTIRSGSTSVIGGYISISGASTTIIGGTSTIIGGTTVVSTPSSTSTAISTTSASSSAAYTSIPTYSNTTTPTSTSAIYSNTTSTGTLPTTTSSTYIRIRLNDAVYPLPACQSGPGSSCLLSTYVDLISAKIEAAGSFYDNCNVTNTAIPSDGVKGASFFTDAGSSWLAEVAP